MGTTRWSLFIEGDLERAGMVKKRVRKCFKRAWWDAAILRVRAARCFSCLFTLGRGQARSYTLWQVGLSFVVLSLCPSQS